MKGPQHGIALVTAILVVALAAIAATAILSSANIAIHRTGNLQNSEYAWWYADGVESWIKSILERDLDDNKIDSLQDAWATPIDYLPIDNGAIRGRVIDLQGRLNLNNLATTDAETLTHLTAVMARLMEIAGVDDPSQAQALVSAIRDWIDADIEPTGYNGAEDSEYLGMDPPYRTANRLMSDVSELLAVRGVNKEIYFKLRPYVCAVPAIDVTINVNTAAPELLTALAAQQRPELAEFVAQRAEKPVEGVQELFDSGAYVAKDPGAQMIGVSSNYFQSQVEVSVGTGQLSLYSSYIRPSGGIPAVYGRSTDTR
jgi:general secretion pathway protein K